MSHDLEFDHEHEAPSAVEQAAVAQLIWEQDTLELRTVGIDIGSSTSHLLFARVTLQRQPQGLSSHFKVVQREVLWRSPIVLTPFLPDGSIDAGALAHFIAHAYHDAGLRRSDIDSGAVILTGEAIKRRNARAVDDIFAADAGKFVCATAGHKLEATLAAHGSGAAALSHRRRQCGLHVDIGGGTTKLALVDHGTVVSVAAFAVGGRLLAQDAGGTWNRIDQSAQQVAQALGIEASPERLADAAARGAIVERLAAIVVDQITGAKLDALGQSLALTEPLARALAPDFVSFSGGVAEYIFGHEHQDYGDIAGALAAAIVRQLKGRLAVPVIEPAERIRATVIGASQFSVQVSGKTIDLPDARVLPVRNVPVVHLGGALQPRIDADSVAASFRHQADLLGLAPDALLALAFAWSGEPTHARLLAMAQAVQRFAAPARQRTHALLLMIDGDVAASIGRLLRHELGVRGPVVSIDGIQLRDFDFVDVGERLDPPGVVPVVIKSLLFAADVHRH